MRASSPVAGNVASLPLDRRCLPGLARGPVFSAMLALAVVLTAVSGQYGFHRDELYFRMLRPGWGYVDEPPLAPLLVRLFSGLVADEPWAIRIPATLATVASVFVLALITRELGGGRGAQALCAWAYSFAALPLIMGHALLTSTVDLPVWPAVLLFVIRAQLRRQPQWWLAAGAVVGLSMYNKLLVPSCSSPWRPAWPWSGHAGCCGRGGSSLRLPWRLSSARPTSSTRPPHGWPQLGMGRALAESAIRPDRGPTSMSHLDW